MKRAWKRFRGWPKWAQITVAATVVILLIGLANTGGNSDEAGSAAPAEPAKVDTGRMSEGEYATFSRVNAKLGDELGEYSNMIGTKCRALLLSVELDAASRCIHDAWGGVWDAGMAVYTTTENLEQDTAKGCLEALQVFRVRLDAYLTLTKQGTEAGENLDFELFNEIQPRATAAAKPFATAAGRVARACAPR